MKLLHLLMAIVTVGVTLPASAAEPIIIKFSHVAAESAPKGKAAAYFKKRAEDLTNGKVKVEVYPNSTLYKDKEEIEALQIGAVQMLAPSLAKFGPLGLKEFEAFDLPYIFDTREALHKVTKGPVGAQLLRRLEPKGIVGLAYWDNGFKHLSGSTPINSPADLKGKKMRIQSSKVLEEEMRALGAIPQVMAFSEVYQALQTGVVDGTENPHSNLYTQKMHEVQKYLTLTGHGYLGYAVIANKAFWDGLPSDIRSSLEKAMSDTTDYANEISNRENEIALEAVRTSGKTEIHNPTALELAAFKKSLAPVHKKMESRIGKETLEAIYSATGSDPSKL
jgi:C4-dicarboxylate-binding protein DctP